MRALESAYLGQAHGTAVNRSRSDMYLPGVHEGSVYAFKSMEGDLVEAKVVALRLNAAYLQAKAKGLGKEIPTDWFLETVHP